MLFLIFISANLIGKIIAKKYTDRLQELEEMKNALNIFKSKIKFTYQPIPEIFEEISNNSNLNIANIFKSSRENMENLSAEEAWIKAIEESKNNLTKKLISAHGAGRYNKRLFGRSANIYLFSIRKELYFGYIRRFIVCCRQP